MKGTLFSIILLIFFMTTTIYNPEKEQAVIQTGLHELTTQLVNTFIPTASLNKSFFVNDIPARLPLETNQQMLASVLSGLLSAIVTHAKESCIRLSAKIYGNVVLVQVKDSASSNTYAVENEVRKLQPIAEKVFGSVSVTSQRKNLTTISFGFVNLPVID